VNIEKKAYPKTHIIAEDGPGTYPIESVALASASAGLNTLTRGKIARVATGGMIPDGANAVIMIEDTKLVTSSESGEEIDIEILVTCTPGENIREIGSDCAIGETIGFAGQRISTVGGDLGALASGGVRHVKVYRKPRVGVVSTGNEVADALTAEKLKPGQVRDTNRLTLLSAIQLTGFEPVDLGIIEDSVEKLEEGLSEALEQVDVLITTGGVSMGESDFMKPILEQKLGATIHFGRVMMKPG
jgi:gephyrin